MAPGQNHFGISYTSEAIFTDLPMPDIKSVSGKAKFIEGESANDNELGYIISVDMADLDFSKVPQKYKESHDKTALANGFTMETPPLTNANYKIEWEFILKDNDGFTLQKLRTGEPTYLVSGKTTVFQGKVAEKILRNVALKVRQIDLHPEIMSCESCIK